MILKNFDHDSIAAHMTALSQLINNETDGDTCLITIITTDSINTESIVRGDDLDSFTETLIGILFDDAQSITLFDKVGEQVGDNIMRELAHKTAQHILKRLNNLKRESTKDVDLNDLDIDTTVKN